VQYTAKTERALRGRLRKHGVRTVDLDAGMVQSAPAKVPPDNVEAQRQLHYSSLYVHWDDLTTALIGMQMHTSSFIHYLARWSCTPAVTSNTLTLYSSPVDVRRKVA
jgi:hypothetical protein